MGGTYWESALFKMELASNFKQTRKEQKHALFQEFGGDSLV